ncbi:RDD family protein [Pilimelia anulata]|nr:RDD family protein [Pilimelia anulata]
MNFANWGQRVGAYLIDQVAVSVPSIIGSLVQAATMEDGRPTGTGIAVSTIGSLITLGLWIFNRVIKQGRTGQSWGKGVLGIKLIREDNGQPVGPGLAFGRDVAHLIDAIICYIGFLFPLWDAKRQTIADKIVRTVVVSA